MSLTTVHFGYRFLYLFLCGRSYPVHNSRERVGHYPFYTVNDISALYDLSNNFLIPLIKKKKKYVLLNPSSYCVKQTVFFFLIYTIFFSNSNKVRMKDWTLSTSYRRTDQLVSPFKKFHRFFPRSK